MHRQIVQEACAAHDGINSTAYLRTAVMGALGSYRAMPLLHETLRQGSNHQTRCTRLLSPLLSLTVCVAQGQRTYTEDKHVALTLVQEEAAWSKREAATEVNLPGPQHTSSTLHVNYPHVNPAYPGAAGTSSFLHKEHQHSPQNLAFHDEIYEYAQAYIHYLDGFVHLWQELFGASCALADGGGDSAGSSHVPPHMFAVPWNRALSPERQLWSKGLMDAGREILRKVVTRQLPVDTYLLYVLYATLSLRVSLLETIAGLFVFSSVNVDICYCVQLLYRSYKLQCEVSRLQDIWAELGLLDSVFLEECERFNEACSVSLGALHHWDLYALRSRRQAFAREESLSARSAARSTSVPSDLSSVTSEPRPLPEVYVPVFSTRCHSTWLLQRLYWSMYGRCTLLFSSCVQMQLTRIVAKDWDSRDGEQTPPREHSPEPSPPHHTMSVTVNRIPETMPATPQQDRSHRVVQWFRQQWLQFCEISPPSLAPTDLSAAHQSTLQSAAYGSANFTGDQPSTFFDYTPTAVAAPTPSFPVSEHTTPSKCGLYHQPIPRELQFLEQGGCYVLAHAIRHAILQTTLPATLMLLTNSTTRHGPVHWRNHQYTLLPSVDDASGRQGMSPWVLNFVLPQDRLPQDPERRVERTKDLMRTILFRIAGRGEERLCFAHRYSLFYLLSSGPDMDSNRLFFVIHYHCPAEGTSEELTLQEHYKDAYSRLEELRVAWTLAGACNDAVRLASALSFTSE